MHTFFHQWFNSTILSSN